MRLHSALRFSFFVITIALPALLHAQFQEPSKEELQMTADPKAPGAAAVYLNIEEVTDDPLHYHGFYARIKVLQEKGKELATVELPYQRGDFNVANIKARTIHSDGTVLPLTGKPEDLLVSKGQDKGIGRKVFTLPSVEVGSILEYYYQLRYDDNHYSSPFWRLQHEYFVHKEHYAFTPFKGFLKGSVNATSHYLTDSRGNVVHSLIWWTQVPPGAKMVQDATGRFSIDLADIPPIPDEDYMPPLNAFLYHISFYYMSAYDSGDFWVSEAKRWSKEVDHFAEPSKSIKEAVAQLISPSDSEIDKAKKLYKAVQQLDNTDFSRQKRTSELKQLHIKAARRAEDTWAQKSGTSDDIALLYLAMLRAAGLTAYAMKVVDRERGVFEPGYLEFDQLDDNIVILSTGGKDIVLDPGQKMCPFQTVHWRHSGTGGIRESADGRAAAVTPEQLYSANNLQRLGEVTLDEHGAITGTFRFIMTGQDALYWRQQALVNDEDEVKKRFDRMLQGIVPEGVEAHIDHFLGLEDPDANLMANVKAQGVPGSATSRRLLLPGFFFEARGNRPFVDQEKRVEPVDMHYADLITDKVVYNLPAGVTVEGAPLDGKTPWGNNAVLNVKVVSEPGKVTIVRSLARGFTVLKPDQYQDLRGFYQKVAASDQQQLVLSVTPERKGN
jgi:transglutaminase-like putative cysteine protease